MPGSRGATLNMVVTVPPFSNAWIWFSGEGKDVEAQYGICLRESKGEIEEVLLYTTVHGRGQMHIRRIVTHYAFALGQYECDVRV